MGSKKILIQNQKKTNTIFLWMLGLSYNLTKKLNEIQFLVVEVLLWIIYTNAKDISTCFHFGLSSQPKTKNLF